MFSVGSAVGNGKNWRLTFLYRVYHLKCNTNCNRIWRLTGNVNVLIAKCFPHSSTWFWCEVMLENEHMFCSWIHDACTYRVFALLWQQQPSNHSHIDLSVMRKVKEEQLLISILYCGTWLLFGFCFKWYTLYYTNVVEIQILKFFSHACTVNAIEAFLLFAAWHGVWGSPVGYRYTGTEDWNSCELLFYLHY
jgi:hypothetical protein